MSATADGPAGREREVLIVLDAGNTQTVVGAYRGDELVGHFRVSTTPERTEDEYAAVLLDLFERRGIDCSAAAGVVIASVVPPLNPVLERLARKYFRVRPLFVEPGTATGLVLRYDNPQAVGADRIANALAARELYGAPAVVVDFGTATTFDVLGPAGDYRGGIICPGLGISADALFQRASRLYRVDVRPPAELVGTNTVAAMQSGLYYGYVGLVDGILARLRDEMGEHRVVATGGQAPLIAGGSRYIDEVDENLTLAGLKLIHELNR